MGPGTIIDSKYFLLAKIGEGGMCTVWEARRLDDGELVAIKFLLADLVDDDVIATRFLREAAVAEAGRRSSHVLTIYEVVEHSDGTRGLVMDRLDGEDLRDLLSREGPLEPEHAAALMVQICRGVAELHGQGIVHRDLKPENIFVTCDELGEETATILDFGIAKFKESPDDKPASFGDSGVISCTPNYAAPEQLHEGGRADHRVDIYALGVVLYELLAGRRPFRCTSAFDAWMEITFERPTALGELREGLPAGLEAVVMRAMARHPEDRFVAVDELAEALAPYARRHDDAPIWPLSSHGDEWGERLVSCVA